MKAQKHCLDCQDRDVCPSLVVRTTLAGGTRELTNEGGVLARRRTSRTTVHHRGKGEGAGHSLRWDDVRGVRAAEWVAMADAVTTVGAASELVAGGGSLSVALKGLQILYARHVANQEKYDDLQLRLLQKVREAHVASGCSSGDARRAPKEFEIDNGEHGPRPTVVDPGQIELRFKPDSLQFSMRIELVELTQLLSVLEEVKDQYRRKPCALWQVVLELNRWITTELPGLLDESRGPPDWARQIKNREDYLKKLDHICTQPECELDPEKAYAGFKDRVWTSDREKDRRVRRFARVMTTLRAHLVAIRTDHAKVMAERMTADLLQQLEHAVKGVVRPAMHAALIMMANVDTPPGMVFSELAADTAEVWSWLDEFKRTELCKLLSDTIKSDEDLQKALHLVDYSRGRPKAQQLAVYAMRAREGNIPDMVDEWLADVYASKASKSNSGLPVGKSSRAQELLSAAAFRRPLQRLVDVNLVQAHTLGNGVAMLRTTQRLAKQLGEVMFAKLCEEKVARFLSKLNDVARHMVNNVAEVLLDMEELARDIANDMRIDRDQDQFPAWRNNVEKASELIKLSEDNLEAMVESAQRIVGLSNSTETDVAEMLKRWEQNITLFVDEEGVPPVVDANPEPMLQLELEPEPEPEPEPESPDLDRPALQMSSMGSTNFDLAREEFGLTESRSLLVFRGTEQRRRRTEDGPEPGRYTVYRFTCVRGLSRNDVVYDFEKELGDFAALEKALPAHAGRFFTGLPPAEKDPMECGPILERWLQQVLYFYHGKDAVRDFIQPEVSSVWEWLVHYDEVDKNEDWCPYSDETMRLLENAYLNPSAKTGRVNIKIRTTVGKKKKEAWAAYVIDLTRSKLIHGRGCFWWQVHSEDESKQRLVRRRSLGIASERSTHRIEPLPEWLLTGSPVPSGDPAAEPQLATDNPDTKNPGTEPAKPASASADAEGNGQLVRQQSRLTRVEPVDPTRPSAHWGWDGTFPCMGRVLKKASVRSEPKEKADKQKWQLEEHEIVPVQREAHAGELQFVYVKLDGTRDGCTGGWVKVSTRGWGGMGSSNVLSFFNE